LEDDFSLGLEAEIPQPSEDARRLFPQAGVSYDYLRVVRLDADDAFIRRTECRAAEHLRQRGWSARLDARRRAFTEGRGLYFVFTFSLRLPRLSRLRGRALRGRLPVRDNLREVERRLLLDALLY
jgi:hypothetical protein